MCIIAVINKGLELPGDKELDKCWENNPHRAGFMYVKDGTIRVHKYDTLVQFKRGLKKQHALLGKDTPFIYHMRYATHGEVNDANTHPFYINKDVAFCHNGVIRKHANEATDEVSDTRVFKDKVLKRFGVEAFFNEGMQLLLGDYIDFSKLAFLDSQGRVSIVNEHKGEWVNGIWYSNDYYKSTRATKATFNRWDDIQAELDAWKQDMAYREQYPSRRQRDKKTCGSCNEAVVELRNMHFTFGGWDQFAQVKVCEMCFNKFRWQHGYPRIKPRNHKCGLCAGPVTNYDMAPTLFDLDDNEFAAVTCEHCIEGMAKNVCFCYSIDTAIKVMSTLSWTRKKELEEEDK